ncbi:MAG: metallophosphoesterase [Methanosarcinales archaeon]
MIGIVSDSHDNITALREAVNLFNDEKVEIVLHAGDVVSPFMIKTLSELNCPFMISFGNNDGDRAKLQKHASEAGGRAEEFIEIVKREKRIGMIHGTDQTIVGALIRSNEFDIVISGHTHTPLVDYKETLHINPGEVSGVLTGERTVALLDEDKLTAEIITL